MTLARFISGGFYSRHLSRMKKYYHTNRDKILSRIEESGFGKHMEIRGEDIGLYFLMEIKEKDIDMDGYIRRLEQKGITIKRVSDYSYHNVSQYERLLIFNYSHILPEELPRVLEAMGECFIKL